MLWTAIIAPRMDLTKVISSSDLVKTLQKTEKVSLGWILLIHEEGESGTNTVITSNIFDEKLITVTWYDYENLINQWMPHVKNRYLIIICASFIVDVSYILAHISCGFEIHQMSAVMT